MTPLTSEWMDCLVGETYRRQFVLTRTLPGNYVEWIGSSTWGAEFGITNPDNPAEVYAVATIANNKAAWVADGILWVVFSQVETARWTFERAAWYLDLVAPNTAVDPFGLRDTVLRGFLRCEARSPTQRFAYSSRRV